MSDERMVAELRELARAVTPTMSLDPDRTVALGRRRRRRGRVLTGGGAVAGTGLVLAAAVALGGPPAGPVVRQPYSVGDGQVVELAPGVSASNSVTAEVSTAGRAWWDTGLSIDDDGTVLHVGLSVVDDALEPLTGIQVGGFDPAAGTGSPWLGAVFDRGDRLRWEAVSAGDEASWRMLVGEVPGGRAAAVLYLPVAVGGSGGPVAVRLPLFADPTGTGRLLYAALVEVPGAAEHVADVLFVAGDGSVPDVTATCGDRLTAVCLASQPDGGTALAEALRAAGADVPGPTPAAVVSLAPGLDAVAGPVTLEGFQTDLGTLAGARVILDRFTDTDPEVVQLAAFLGAEYTAGTPLDLPLGDGYAVVVAAMAGGARVEVGVLPTGSDGTRVIAWSDATGDLQVIEVPTFTVPVPGTDEPERLFYALGLAPDTGWRAGRIAFLGADGTLTDTECAAPDPGACLPEGLRDAVAGLGAD